MKFNVKITKCFSYKAQTCKNTLSPDYNLTWDVIFSDKAVRGTSVGLMRHLKIIP